MSITKAFTFQAGTKARANEVNKNFDDLYSQVNINISDISQNAQDIESLDSRKANINGSSAQRFAVADPVNQTDAVNKQTAELITNPNIILLDGIGNVNLTTNTINKITPTGAVNFILPDVSNSNTINQILVQVYMDNVYSIDVGTTSYFNNKSPNLSTVGSYNLIFEYDILTSTWVCGWMRK